MQSNFRRVVTGHDEHGKSMIVSDALSPLIFHNPMDPDFASADYFRTSEMPARIVADTPETTGGPRRQLPDKNGTVLRVNYFPPEVSFYRDLTPEGARRMFGALGNEKASTFGRGGRHPMSHRTETIDYAIVVAGEITMVLDKEDVVLRAGDVVVQCGTDHAWSNRSNEMAVVYFILIDGVFEPSLESQFE